MLLQEKKRLREQLGEAGTAERMVAFRDSVTDLSFADNHPADLGSENFERSKDLSLREHHLTHLRLIEEALGRIDRGIYGICPRCGASIPEERLEAIPEAPFCLTCQEFEESRLKASGRPMEEGGLLPPFTRKNIPGSPGFDAEDFWQEAARHNKRPLQYEDWLEEEDTGLVEETDAISNQEHKDQLYD